MDTAGERLKRARAYLNLSQGEFCDRVDISNQSYLSDIERPTGTRTLSSKLADKIQDRLGVSSNWLLTGQGEMMLSDDEKTASVKQNVEKPGDRLRQWRTSKGLSQEDVANKIGYGQGAISAAENREPKNVADKLAYKLERHYGLSYTWLKMGIGNPDGTISTTVNEPGPQYNKGPMNVVKTLLSNSVNNDGEQAMSFVDTKAKAGYVRHLEEDDFVHDLPSVKIPGFEDGIFRVFEISGMSMHETLFPDDLVICKKLDDPSEIRDDRIHVIVTKNDGVLVKRVLNRLNRTNKLILTSDNNADGNYPPMSVRMDQVIEIWYVQGRVTRQLPHPNKIAERVRNLEGDIQELIMRLDEKMKR